MHVISSPNEQLPLRTADGRDVRASLANTSEITVALPVGVEGSVGCRGKGSDG